MGCAPDLADTQAMQAFIQKYGLQLYLEVAHFSVPFHSRNDPETKNLCSKLFKLANTAGKLGL